MKTDYGNMYWWVSGQEEWIRIGDLAIALFDSLLNQRHWQKIIDSLDNHTDSGSHVSLELWLFIKLKMLFKKKHNNWKK